jgi:hypothetical protein
MGTTQEQYDKFRNNELKPSSYSVRYYKKNIEKKTSHIISLQLLGVKLLMQEMNMQEEEIPQHGVF